MVYVAPVVHPLSSEVNGSCAVGSSAAGSQISDFCQDGISVTFGCAGGLSPVWNGTTCNLGAVAGVTVCQSGVADSGAYAFGSCTSGVSFQSNACESGSAAT